ncbi:hypothetical protein [Actinoplanes solisilvae]|uniref:hypothetical protein n=1 Tax=Actinoplanes solisilvae TaxID=2486853 RepID=UPI000FDB54DD|nr:hypothetical protein [Actinoplanes solisilvae]
MPRRRLIALPLFLISGVLLAGCEIELAPGAIPAPISIAPTPSESAGVPKYVCSQTYKILTEGAVQLAQQAAGSGDETTAAMKQTLTGMAAQVDEELTRATDPGLRAALLAISADLTEGAEQPKDYLTGGFETVGQRLDGHCE